MLHSALIPATPRSFLSLCFYARIIGCKLCQEPLSFPCRLAAFSADYAYFLLWRFPPFPPSRHSRSLYLLSCPRTVLAYSTCLAKAPPSLSLVADGAAVGPGHGSLHGRGPESLAELGPESPAGLEPVSLAGLEPVSLAALGPGFPAESLAAPELGSLPATAASKRLSFRLHLAF